MKTKETIKSERKERDMTNSDASINEVIVTDVKMNFGSMVIFMVKWVIASIPAFIILFFIGAIFTGIFAGIAGSR